jgi:hypothetical protein
MAATDSEVTREQAEARVQMTEYFTIPNTCVTIATLHLENGAKVTGESSVVNPANFDVLRGREIAREKAMKRLVELEGYLQAERRHRASMDRPGVVINVNEARHLVAILEAMNCAGRQEVNLGRINGRLQVWDDESDPTPLEP